jgi:hypothetical protein
VFTRIIDLPILISNYYTETICLHVINEMMYYAYEQYMLCVVHVIIVIIRVLILYVFAETFIWVQPNFILEDIYNARILHNK